MMSAWENMEMQMSGNTSPVSSITCLWQLSLKRVFSVFMVVFLQVSILLTKSSNLIELWKYLMKDLSAIFFGQIQMIDVDGVSHQEEQVILSDKISPSSSTIPMT